MQGGQIAAPLDDDTERGATRLFTTFLGVYGEFRIRGNYCCSNTYEYASTTSTTSAEQQYSCRQAFAARYRILPAGVWRAWCEALSTRRVISGSRLHHDMFFLLALVLRQAMFMLLCSSRAGLCLRMRGGLGISSS